MHVKFIAENIFLQVYSILKYSIYNAYICLLKTDLALSLDMDTKYCFVKSTPHRLSVGLFKNFADIWQTY